MNSVNDTLVTICNNYFQLTPLVGVKWDKVVQKTEFTMCVFFHHTANETAQ